MPMGRPVKNKHKVPKKVWSRWSPEARKVFNAMYHSMRPSMQFVYMHPDATPMPATHWSVIRWNAAWMAAEACNV